MTSRREYANEIWYKSPIPELLNNITLVKFKNEITAKLIWKKTLDEEEWCIGQFNLLRNVGIIPKAQNPHYDYPPRQVEWVYTNN